MGCTRYKYMKNDNYKKPEIAAYLDGNRRKVVGEIHGS